MTFILITVVSLQIKQKGQVMSKYGVGLVELTFYSLLVT